MHEPQLLPKTPKNITTAVLTFCAEVSPGETPKMLVIQPAPGSISGECFPNVIEQVKKLGGNIQHGWKITQFRDLVIEAEFHAVWVSPDGTFVDITFDPANDRSFFVPDKKVKYEGKQVNSIRKPLVNNPLADEYIAIHNKFYEMMNRGVLADQFGKVTLDGNEYRQNVMRLGRVLHQLDYPSTGKIGRNDPCPCGSGSKYKKCHGSNIE